MFSSNNIGLKIKYNFTGQCKINCFNAVTGASRLPSAPEPKGCYEITVNSKNLELNLAPSSRNTNTNLLPTHPFHSPKEITQLSFLMGADDRNKIFRLHCLPAFCALIKCITCNTNVSHTQLFWISLEGKTTDVLLWLQRKCMLNIYQEIFFPNYLS